MTIRLLWITFAFTALAFQPDGSTLRRIFEEGLARRQRDFGDQDVRTAQAARDLGFFLQRAGDVEAARRALQQALTIDEKALGSDAPRTLEDAGALAAISPPVSAAPLLLRASRSTDPSVAGPALTALAGLRKSAGDRIGAAQFLRRAVIQAEALEGKDAPLVALTLRALAAVAEPDEAIPCLRRALEIDAKTAGRRNAQTQREARNLANVLRRVGRTAEAGALEREFIYGASKQPPSKPPAP